MVWAVNVALHALVLFVRAVPVSQVYLSIDSIYHFIYISVYAK
jgi:hypothetical protein